MQYETVIGLEVHTQLQTQSKLFSNAPVAYGADPNSQACEIDLALPGVLPVLNQKAVELAILFGLSINATINPRSIFARKNYFYADLPKGYQISQFDEPIVIGGHLDITTEDGIEKRIQITRAHLEEDAGKSTHMNEYGLSGIDLNRAGTPLLEIVSEPDFRSSKEVISYLKKLHHLVRYLGICDGNMQEGSFRCDINISLRPHGQKEYGTRAEIKNVNSFRFIKQAIEYEVKRQTECLNRGEKIQQETRQYDATTNATYSMRSKEEAHDYRYFPDPDLLPVHITQEQINHIKQSLPELPWQREHRYQESFNLTPDEVKQIMQDLVTADYFESIKKLTPDIPAKNAVNLISVDLATLTNKHAATFADIPITPQHCADLLHRIHDKTISNHIAKEILSILWGKNDSVDNIIEKRGLKQMNNPEELREIARNIITQNPKQVEQYRQGKNKLLGFFVGQVMKQTKGKANPQQVNHLLLKELPTPEENK